MRLPPTGYRGLCSSVREEYGETGNAMALRLRAWQRQALEAWEKRSGPNFLAVATPGAGKTTFALAAAHVEFAAGRIDQLVVVCPSEHLKHQWADAAAAAGIPLDPTFTNTAGVTSPQFVGIVVTYAQVASAPAVHAAGVRSARTMVLLDEAHHAGADKSWGDGLVQAYESAVCRLLLSGTPWRSDVNPIPYVQYGPDEAGAVTSVADYRYGYGPALADGVVRPVVFMAYSGQARWRDGAGNELEAHLDDPMSSSTMRRAWRTALDPKGQWLEAVLSAADARLSAVRASGMRDAGGLVIASNKTHAHAYAAHLRRLTGQPVTVVTSDDPGASAAIETFAAGTARWLVAVKMVSEGVDIPRLAVGVYATNAATPLFFAQAIGRFVRARGAGESATVFLPSVPPLLALAADLEAERDHVLTRPGPGPDGLDDDLLREANQKKATADAIATQFVAVEASGHFDRVIFAGDEHGVVAATGSEAEQQWLTLPGLLHPEELASSVRARAGAQIASSKTSQVNAQPLPLHRQVSAARRELHSLVGALHHRTGAHHAEIHARLRTVCGGPVSAAATLEQLQERVSKARAWL